MSSYIAKGPISLLEVMGCLSHCHNLYHVHQSNALFLVYMLLVFLLAFHMVQSAVHSLSLLRQHYYSSFAVSMLKRSPLICATGRSLCSLRSSELIHYYSNGDYAAAIAAVVLLFVCSFRL